MVSSSQMIIEPVASQFTGRIREDTKITEETRGSQRIQRSQMIRGSQMISEPVASQFSGSKAEVTKIAVDTKDCSGYERLQWIRKIATYWE